MASLATVLLVAASFQAGGMVDPSGIEIISVQKGFPAEILEEGSVIHKINGVEVRTVEEYINQSLRVAPGEDITLETDRGVFTLASVPNPANASRAYLGFNIKTHLSLKKEFSGQEAFFSFLIASVSLLEIIFFLNLNIAIVNLLPVVPFDGFKMFEELLKSFNIGKKRRKRIINWVVLAVVLLLAVNALPLGRVFWGN
jgi:membrane-associated protease RseP (regulator of RpoE activity)